MRCWRTGLHRLMHWPASTSSRSQQHRQFATKYSVRAPAGSESITIKRPLKPIRDERVLQSVTINYTRIGTRGKPVIYIMPSMSHSSNVSRVVGDGGHWLEQSNEAGWWEAVVGSGQEYGIDLDEYEIVCASALGAPYGTTSPITAMQSDSNHLYRYEHFPVITPADQARVHAMLLDELGIQRVHAVVGASMGGMAAIQFAALFNDRYDRLVAICTTAQTSPSTVALRSTQRAAVMLDSKWQNGDYNLDDGPADGMMLARQIGTIAYRSRDEFDSRFNWQPDSQTHKFDVERYLEHGGEKFSSIYDANCYLTLSRCMDLMNVAYDRPTYEQGCRKIPRGKQVMLLPIGQDALIPYHELQRFGSVLGSQGVDVHLETLSSMYGHDAFLKEHGMISPRLSAFLRDGVPGARRYLHEINMY